MSVTTTEHRIPSHYKGIPDVTTNAEAPEKAIDEDVAQRLKHDPATYAGFPAWHFYGKVWWKDGNYHVEVWQYGVYRATYTGPTLKELCSYINDLYGWK